MTPPGEKTGAPYFLSFLSAVYFINSKGVHVQNQMGSKLIELSKRELERTNKVITLPNKVKNGLLIILSYKNLCV